VSSGVLGHLGINVPDLELARRYYTDLLPRVGFETFLDDDDQFAFMPANGKRGTFLFFYPTESREPYSRRTTTGLQHLAFMVPGRSAVDEVHAWACAVGSDVVLEPQVFPEYPPPYYASFWLDPFGIMLEVVCHHDRD
jgi:catechol 2,3-dioxygenase-like lactoylglutathione lyase family enzyme